MKIKFAGVLNIIDFTLSLTQKKKGGGENQGNGNFTICRTIGAGKQRDRGVKTMTSPATNTN